MDLFNPAIFEMVMLLCFGCSWPLAIAKTIRTRSVEGVSIYFISMVFVGYLAGIAYKLIVHFDGVIWLYAANGSMVLTEIILYIKYGIIEAQSNTSCGCYPGPDEYQTTAIKKGEAYGS